MKYCRHCQAPLIVKKTKTSPSQLQKQYYYTAYEYCPKCRRIYHNNKYKVENPLKKLEESPLFKDADIDIWTDGACSNNGQANARAAWAFVSGKYEKAGLVSGKQTNNTAEAYAIYHALVWAAEQGYKAIRLHSDSQISLNNLKKDTELIKENRVIFELIKDVTVSNKLHVSYVKVLGHSGDPNNERADVLATSLVEKTLPL